MAKICRKVVKLVTSLLRWTNEGSAIAAATSFHGGLNFFISLFIIEKGYLPPYFISAFISAKNEWLPSNPFLEEFICCLISEGYFNLVPSFNIVNEGSALNNCQTTFNGGPIYFLFNICQWNIQIIMVFSFLWTYLLAAWIIIFLLHFFLFFTFLQVNTHWRMVNSENYLRS